MHGERCIICAPTWNGLFLLCKSSVLQFFSHTKQYFSLTKAISISEHATVVTTKVCGLLATINFQDYLVLVMNEYGALVE